LLDSIILIHRSYQYTTEWTQTILIWKSKNLATSSPSNTQYNQSLLPGGTMCNYVPHDHSFLRKVHLRSFFESTSIFFSRKNKTQTMTQSLHTNILTHHRFAEWMWNLCLVGWSFTAVVINLATSLSRIQPDMALWRKKFKQKAIVISCF
jgi:hypothetical protein